MSSKKSLIARLRGIFGIFLLLDIAFLFAINQLSLHDLKTHVVEINQQALENVTENWNNTMSKVGTYIVNISYQERSALGVIMTATDQNSTAYILASNEMRRRFQDDLMYVGDMSAYFVYAQQLDDLVFVTAKNDAKYTEDKEKIRSSCNENGAWHMICTDGSSFLIKAINVGYDTYIGAILDVSDIVMPLKELYPETEPTFRLTDKAQNILYDDTDPDRQKYVTGIESEIRAVEIRIEEMIPTSYIYSQIPYLQLLLLFAISLCILILMFVFYIFHYNEIQKPIQSLISSLKKVESGIMDARVEEQGSYEFDYLIRSYNAMLDKIYKLKLNIAETELNKKYLELKQLQAQINPHFFMNSLNLISSLSALRDHETTLRLVRLLSDYFRFTVRNNEIFTTIGKEVEHVRTCLEIHKIRFPQNLDYECIVDESLTDIRIPLLTIQPLTENSIIHGMKNEKSAIFKVTVKIERKNGDIRITVSDNGSGFTEESIRYIKSGLGDSKKTEHIGIQNVYLRLNMFYDGGVGMDFRNNEEGGAETVITIPGSAVRKEE